MSDPVSSWPRPAWQPGGTPARFHLFCFAPGPLAEVPFSASRFGLPAKALPPYVEVRELPRDADQAWFDGFRRGSLRTLAQQALGDLAALDAADRLAVVLVSRPDAADLGHLQAAWALAQWLVARGATVVLDGEANRFWRGDDVASWPPARPFTLSTDVNVVVEAEPTSPTATVHTRGLAKVGRPDLVLLDVTGAEWDAAAALLRVLGGRLAMGEVLREGPAPAGVEGVRALRRYAPTPGHDLHLNNEALVVER